MDLENLNFRAKDIVSFLVYIIPATFFVATINAKVDKVADAIVELQMDRKDTSSESKTSGYITQNDIKALQIRAELNRQSIEILKMDIQNLKNNMK